MLCVVKKTVTPLSMRSLDDVADDEVALDIEPGGGFIKEEQARAVHQAHCDSEPPPHAFGEPVHAVTPPFIQLKALQKLRRVTLPLAAANAIELCGEHHVLPPGQVSVYVGGLGDDAHGLPCGNGLAHDIVAEDGCRSRGRS